MDVCETETGAVSCIRHWRIRDELNQLRPSAHLVVSGVSRIDSAVQSAKETPQTASTAATGALWIVRSTATNLLMTVRTTGAEPGGEGHGPIAVEVARRWIEDGMVRIETVLRGTAVARVDLPAELIAPPRPLSERGVLDQGKSVDPAPIASLGDQLDTLPNMACYNLSAALKLSIPLLGTEPDTRPDTASVSLWRVLADLYLRGLRSFHVEPLARRHALRLRGQRAEDENLGVAKQIDEIFSLAGKPGARNLADSIERLILFANLYPLTQNSVELVYAVAAAFGARHDLRGIRRADGVIARLVTATRPFLLARETFAPAEIQRLENAARICFEDLRDHLLSSNVDIPMLRGFRDGQP